MFNGGSTVNAGGGTPAPRTGPEAVSAVVNPTLIVQALIPHNTPRSKAIRQYLSAFCLNVRNERVFVFRQGSGWTSVALDSTPERPKLTCDPVSACNMLLHMGSQCPDVSTVTLLDANQNVITIDIVKAIAAVPHPAVIIPEPPPAIRFSLTPGMGQVGGSGTVSAPAASNGTALTFMGGAGGVASGSFAPPPTGTPSMAGGLSMSFNPATAPGMGMAPFNAMPGAGMQLAAPQVSTNVVDPATNLMAGMSSMMAVPAEGGGTPIVGSATSTGPPDADLAMPVMPTPWEQVQAEMEAKNKALAGQVVVLEETLQKSQVAFDARLDKFTTGVTSMFDALMAKMDGKVEGERTSTVTTTSGGGGAEGEKTTVSVGDEAGEDGATPGLAGSSTPGGSSAISSVKEVAVPSKDPGTSTRGSKRKVMGKDGSTD